MRSDASLVLLNANVLTMSREQPGAEAVAVSGQRILTVGNSADVRSMASGRTRVIDCQGMTLLPGFNDAHCHLPGLARRLQDLDCSPESAPSIAALQSLVRRHAESRPNSRWVRGFGYDDRQMAEGRHPNRWDLDAAAPRRPVWLEHRSGHAAALNSLALEIAGIHTGSPDPPGGLIERDSFTGEPTGILIEMRHFLRERLGNTRSRDEFEEGMRTAGRLLASYGVTSMQDAGADNGIERWRSFQHLLSTGALPGRITMFAGAERLNEFTACALGFGSQECGLRLGHAKIMLTMTAGALHPPARELAGAVAKAHSMGFPVAIHCIEEEAIAAATERLASRRSANQLGYSDCEQQNQGAAIAVADRIEHCAEGTPSLIQAVQRAGAAVVTQPGFVYHNGASYRRNVEEGLLPHLYPAGALHRAGVNTAFGSDAPVIDPNPWPAIYSAVTRNAADGRPLSGEGQTVSTLEALRMYTVASAVAEGTAGDKGRIAEGMLADMTLVDTNPLTSRPEDLPGIRTVMTITGGRVVWEESSEGQII